MSRNFRLRPISEDEDSRGEESKLIDRRDFLRYSFNTAAGGITLASLGSIGFASLLMGQAAQKKPVVLIKGYKFKQNNISDSRSLIRSEEEDLFR